MTKWHQADCPVTVMAAVEPGLIVTKSGFPGLLKEVNTSFGTFCGLSSLPWWTWKEHLFLRAGLDWATEAPRASITQSHVLSCPSPCRY